MTIKSAKDLTVYQKHYALAMQIFEVSECFTKEKLLFSASDTRRSSRFVPMNLYGVRTKGRDKAHCNGKLNGSDGESNETDTFLDFAPNWRYIIKTQHIEFAELNAPVSKMIQDPAAFLISNN
jgi:four helix bundle protein